ncbi:MAG TPA: transcription elongation factor GreA [Verrucomicrobiae bacterium]|nr:transcription elongation factor GreA [Verrucomicrobiae bacterium]
MTEPRSLGAAELLRSVGLLADGPVHWGNPVRVGGPGVYIVELAAPLKSAPVDHQVVGQWIERVPGLTLDGARPTARELAVRLGEFWLPDETVVYIGMTNLSIGGRVAAFVKTPLGDRRPHAGGHWLKTLTVLPDLRVWWAPTSAPEEYEDALLSGFAQAVSPAARAGLRDASVVVPFGNLQTATNERKQHGIRGALLVDEAGGPVTKAERLAAAAAARGAKSAGGKRTGVLRSSPVRPRSTTPRAPSGSRAAAAAVKAAGKPAGPAVHLSPEGLLALRAELDHLTTVQRPAIVARIAAARELGDLKENSDYHEARREQSFAEGRVRQLEDQLRNAVVVEGDGGTVVSIGSTVVVERMDAAGALETTTFKIVGAAEASPKTDRISNVSPIGAALVGRSPGDAVEVVIPTGRIGFRILEVR